MDFSFVLICNYCPVLYYIVFIVCTLFSIPIIIFIIFYLPSSKSPSPSVGGWYHTAQISFNRLEFRPTNTGIAKTKY